MLSISQALSKALSLKFSLIKLSLKPSLSRSLQAIIYKLSFKLSHWFSLSRLGASSYLYYGGVFSLTINILGLSSSVAKYLALKVNRS